MKSESGTKLLKFGARDTNENKINGVRRNSGVAIKNACWRLKGTFLPP